MLCAFFERDLPKNPSVCKMSLNYLSLPLADLNISDDRNVTFLAKVQLCLSMSIG